MKATKKIAGILLAILLVFAMTTTAFAAGTGTITVDNPQAGQTYTAYKIFDVVYDAEGHYSYTIDSNNEWFSTVQAYATAENGMTLTQVIGTTTYNVSTTAAFSASKFANTLKAAVSGKTAGIALADQGDGTVKAANLDLGYYFVSSSTGAICNLTTTNPTATIHDKNDVPFDKVDDKSTVDVGETVNYTITGKVPDYTGYATYTYLITDTMSTGLTFKKDVKVTIGGTDVTTACTVTYDVDGNANKFTVSIPVKNYTFGAEIKVAYSAVVNKNAVAKIEKNSATLTYSNDPVNNTTATTTPDEETVYSAKIVIDKYAAGSESTKLEGAEFYMYKKVGEANKYYKVADNGVVSWVDTKETATKMTTNAQGAASFDGIADGTYYLEEVKAPAGYNLLTGPVEVTVNGTTATEADSSALTVTKAIENNTGSLLPSTGGVGTTMMFIVGGALALGAAVLFVTKKRMSKNAD